MSLLCLPKWKLCIVDIIKKILLTPQFVENGLGRGPIKKCYRIVCHQTPDMTYLLKT